MPAFITGKEIYQIGMPSGPQKAHTFSSLAFVSERGLSGTGGRLWEYSGGDSTRSQMVKCGRIFHWNSSQPLLRNSDQSSILWEIRGLSKAKWERGSQLGSQESSPISDRQASSSSWIVKKSYNSVGQANSTMRYIVNIIPQIDQVLGFKCQERIFPYISYLTSKKTYYNFCSVQYLL